MRHFKLLLLTFVAGSLFLNSCKKYDDSLPTVEFVSAVPFGTDSVVLTGKVLTTGADDIQYVGFSYSSVPTNNFTDNQLLLVGTNGSFSYPTRMPQDSTYYIKCFAANSFGYAVSSATKFTVPTATLDSASCPLNADVVTDNGTNWNMAFIATGPSYAPQGVFGIQASDVTSTETVTIQFKSTPINAIYTTEAGLPFNSDNNPYEVNISLQVGPFTNYTINTGGKVYVTVYKSGTVTVSFCSLTYTFSGTNYPFSGKILY